MDGNIDLVIKLLTLVGFVGSAVLLFFRMGRMAERFELIGHQQAEEIRSLKMGVEKIGDLMIDVALQKQRLDSHEQRLNLLDQRYEALRIGDGYITARSRQAMDRTRESGT